jgi:hypothetical protein
VPATSAVVCSADPMVHSGRTRRAGAAVMNGANRGAAARVVRPPGCKWTRESDSRARHRGYLAILVVNQICGGPLTPAFSIAAFSSGEATNALARSREWKTCVTVTSFGLSVD